MRRREFTSLVLGTAMAWPIASRAQQSSRVLLIGVLMGYIAGRFNLESGATLTRVMVLLCTVQELCIFFEVEIATPYVVWMRSMVAIGLLHLVFARRTGLERESDDHDAAAAATVHPMPLLARYPNVLS